MSEKQVVEWVDDDKTQPYVQNVIADDNTCLPGQNIKGTHFMILPSKLDNAISWLSTDGGCRGLPDGLLGGAGKEWWGRELVGNK